MLFIFTAIIVGCEITYKNHRHYDLTVDPEGSFTEPNLVFNKGDLVIIETEKPIAVGLESRHRIRLRVMYSDETIVKGSTVVGKGAPGNVPIDWGPSRIVEVDIDNIRKIDVWETTSSAPRTASGHSIGHEFAKGMEIIVLVVVVCPACAVVGLVMLPFAM